MKLKTRNFPHPVLHPINDDIIKSYFTGGIIDQRENTDALEFYLEFKLKNDTLNSLFEQNLVHINVHFECLSTMQRLSYKIGYSECTIVQKRDELVYTIQISVKKTLLNKKVDVNYFILSNFNIPNYTNSNMHPDFIGTTFVIEKGDILALAVTQTIHLEKDELVTTNSIFTIAKDPSTTSPLSIAMNNNQIEIILPSIIHEQIGQLKLNGNNVNKVLISMLYYPALLDVLHTLQSFTSNEFELFESLDWYRTLEKKIKNLGQEITNLNQDNITSLAYNLLYESIDEPWTALDEVIFSTEGAEEDE